jgi:hypothetical protein
MKPHNYLSLQINIICMLVALIGATVITRHPAWFGGPPKGLIPSLEFIAPISK